MKTPHKPLLTGAIVAAGPPTPSASECPTQDLPLGTCFFCSKETYRGRILAHTPVLKIQCTDCKRVDQALSREFGSIQWLRDMPFAEATAFYNSAHPLEPAGIAGLCCSGQVLQQLESKDESSGGAYWPLSKWTNEGYDADRIEATATDEDNT